MSITVNTASTNIRFTTLGGVKNDLGIGSTDQDSYLDGLILEASDFIRTFTNREFARETVTEKLPKRFASPRLMVSRTPVRTVLFIEHNGSSVSSTSYEIEDRDAGIIWREDRFHDTAIYNHYISRYPSRFGRKDYKVKYEAGYKMPGSTDRDLPYDLERAAREIVTQTFLESDINKNVVREDVGEARIDYANPVNQLAIPKAAEDRLRPWVRAEVHINS